MERELLAELCRLEDCKREKIEQLLNEKLDYSYILGQLYMNRMAATAYYNIKKYELLGKINREFRTGIKDAYYYNQYKAASYKKMLHMLSEMLIGADFSYLVLKGAVLSFIYPIGLRTSNDIDLLVLRKEIPKVVEFFRKQGFTQGFIRNEKIVAARRNEIINAQLNRGEIIPFVKEVKLPGMPIMEIDINVSLDENPMENTDAIEKMVERKCVFEVGENATLYTLDKEDFFIHLCMHLYKEATIYQWVEMGRDLSVYKFSDIYLYYNKYFADSNWEKLVKRIREYGLEPQCYYAMYFTGELYETDMFHEVLKQIGEGKDCTSKLDMVYNQKNKKYYRYTKEFLERLFYGKREELLEET